MVRVFVCVCVFTRFQYDNSLVNNAGVMKVILFAHLNKPSKPHLKNDLYPFEGHGDNITTLKQNSWLLRPLLLTNNAKLGKLVTLKHNERLVYSWVC